MASPDVIDMTRGVYRRIYSGFLWGRRINAVSMEAEAWFWRLVAVADDMGNFRADIEALVSDASPRRRVSDDAVGVWMAELRRPGPGLAPLIVLYESDGEEYGHIENWEALQPMARDPQTHRPRRPIMRVPAHHAHSCADMRSESEPETDTNTKTEAESAPEDISGRNSDSDSPELRRPRARITWHPVVAPLLGRAGTGQRPVGDKQHAADATCADLWWDEIWPIDDEASGRVRFERAMKLISRARDKDRPMAWVTPTLKRERLIT